MIRFLLVTAVLLLAVAAVWLFEDDLPAGEVDARYASPASAFVAAGNGVRIHFRDQGPRNGLPVVLIHGSNASLHTWEPWVAELGDSFRVVTLDLPAHGLTGAVPDSAYGDGAMNEAVHAVTEHLGLNSFVLGGNSMGGGVTWRYALTHPERVRAMILVDASSPRDWQRGEPAVADGDTPLAFALLRQQWFRSAARYLDPYYLVAQGLRAAYADDSLVDEVLIERYRDLALRAGSRQAILERFADSAAREAGEPPDLRRLTQPTLILWGARDTLIGVEVARRFHEVLPDSELIVYDDLGHVPMEEAPQRTAADVRTFLEALGRPDR